MIPLITFIVTALLTVTTTASAEIIGFSQVGTESDWRIAFTADMREEAKTRGIDLRSTPAERRQAIRRGSTLYR